MFGRKRIAILLWVTAVTAFAGSTPDMPVVEPDETPLSVEEILTREPEDADYEEAVRCVPSSRIRRTEVLDDKHMVLEMGRDEYYVIQFRHRCMGLRPGRPVIYEPTSAGRLCALDFIRPTHPSGLGDLTPGGPCSIPGFQLVSKEQVVMLKDALKAARRQELEARRAARHAKKETGRTNDQAPTPPVSVIPDGG